MCLLIILSALQLKFKSMRQFQQNMFSLFRSVLCTWCVKAPAEIDKSGKFHFYELWSSSMLLKPDYNLTQLRVRICSTLQIYISINFFTNSNDNLNTSNNCGLDKVIDLMIYRQLCNDNMWQWCYFNWQHLSLFLLRL